MATARIKKTVMALPPKERAELAHLLIASLDEEVDDGAEASWDRELQRRADEIHSGTEHGEPAEVVFEEIRQQYH